MIRYLRMKASSSFKLHKVTGKQVILFKNLQIDRFINVMFPIKCNVLCLTKVRNQLTVNPKYSIFLRVKNALKDDVAYLPSSRFIIRSEKKEEMLAAD